MPAGSAQLQAVGIPERIRGAEFVSAESEARADPAGLFAPIAQNHGNRTVWMSGREPDGAPHLAAIQLQLNFVFALQLQLLAPWPRSSARDCPSRSESSASGLPAASHCWQSAHRRPLGSRRKMISSPLRRGRSWRQREFDSNRLWCKGRACDESIVQRTVPPALEVRAGVLRLPVALGQFVAGCLICIGQELDQFALAVSAVQRSNQRLNKAHRTIEAARIAPLLKVVRSRHTCQWQYFAVSS